MICWLASNGYIEVAHNSLVPATEAWPNRDCQPPYDPAHLIPRQLLRHTFPHGAYLPINEHIWKRIERGSTIEPIDKVRDLYELLHDERIIREGCRRCHHAFDFSRKLRILPDDLPPSVYEFATEMGLLHWLQLEYRERVAA